MAILRLDVNPTGRFDERRRGYDQPLFVDHDAGAGNDFRCHGPTASSEGHIAEAIAIAEAMEELAKQIIVGHARQAGPVAGIPRDGDGDERFGDLVDASFDLKRGRVRRVGSERWYRCGGQRRGGDKGRHRNGGGAPQCGFEK